MTFSLVHLFSFRVANFIWMIGVSIYAFKRWVLPGIQSTMMAYKKHVAFIRSENQHLQTRYNQIVQKTHNQDELGKALFIKIMEWQRHIDQQKLIQEQQWRTFDYALTAYAIEQRRSVEQLYIKRDIQHEVYEVAYEKLKNKYHSAIEQQDYIKGALDIFTKGDA